MTQDAGLVLEFEWNDLVKPLLQAEMGSGPLHDLITAGMFASVEVLESQITARTPVNLGTLSQAIAASKAVDYGDSVWTGVVSDGGVVYGAPVEYGRAAGRMPPVDDIEFWVIRKGVVFYRQTRRARMVKLSTRQTAWAIAMHIAREGTHGAFMFREGTIAARPYIEQIWDDLMDDILATWAASIGEPA